MEEGISLAQYYYYFCLIIIFQVNLGRLVPLRSFPSTCS